MSGVSGFTKNHGEKNDQQQSIKHFEDESNPTFVANDNNSDSSNFTLNRVQNKQNLVQNDTKIKLLTNVPENSYDELYVKQSDKIEKEKSDDEDVKYQENANTNGGDEKEESKTYGTSNFTFDYVKNAKRKDINVELLKNEPETPKEDETKKDEEEKIETPQLDPRFPNQNQTSHCWSAYVDYHRSVNLLGEGHNAAKYFKKVYTSMCPNRWVERWDEQRENGTFPAIIDRVKLKEDEEICDESKEDYEECIKRQADKQGEKEDKEETKAEKKKSKDEKNEQAEDEKGKKKKKGKKFFLW